jgi:hypothetical protein
MNIEAYNEDIISQARALSAFALLEQLQECTGGRQFGSLVDPGREARAWADAFYEQEKDVLIVVGTGRAHYHQALIERMNESQILFVLDWQLPLIANALREGLDTRRRPQVELGLFHDVQEAKLFLTSIFDRFITRRIKFGFIPPYRRLFPDVVDDVETGLRSYLSASLVQSRTNEFFGLEWATNHHFNLSRMIERGAPFRLFVDQFPEVPAVIVAAGPSLEQNVELLRDITDKAVIVAAGSAIETLAKVHGIVPHFLCSFDAGQGNYPHFQDLDTKRLRLIFTGDLYPPIVEEFEGVLIPAEAINRSTYDVYKHCGAPPLGGALIGPSVANFALDAAVRLGCNPIILIGQDLALRDGRTHAEGNHYCMKTEELSGYLRVRGNVDEFVYTSKAWLTMLKHFEAQIGAYPQNLIINATEGGAFISGTTVKPLREAIAEHVSRPMGIEARIGEIMQAPRQPSVLATEVLAGVESEIYSLKESLEQTLPEIEKLLARLSDGPLASKGKRRVRKIKNMEDRLISSLYYRHIIKTLIYGRVLFQERRYARLASEQPDQVERWVAEYQQFLFRSSIDAIGTFLAAVNDGSGQEQA